MAEIGKYTLLHKGSMKRIFDIVVDGRRREIELGSTLDEGIPEGVVSPEQVVEKPVMDALEKEPYFAQLVKEGEIIVFSGVRK